MIRVKVIDRLRVRVRFKLKFRVGVMVWLSVKKLKDFKFKV